STLHSLPVKYVRTSATGVEPTARKAAYHQISRMYRVDCGIRTRAPPEKVTILPSVSICERNPRDAREGSRGRGGAGVGRVGVRTAMLASPQDVVGVEQGEHRGRVQVLEDLDAHEGRHHCLVD